MPGPVGVALAGLAAKSWAEMWKLYNERYGKWGEEVVRRLQREIEHLDTRLSHMREFLDAMTIVAQDERAMVEYMRDQWHAASDRANELAARLNEATIRLERADLPANPFDEGEEGVPEPTERTDP
jgi:hypothetical protein